MFYYCLHVDVWQLSLWWLRGTAAQPTCVIIVYVYIINVSCYFLHFHFILFCYFLHFDVLLLCKHLTAFLVVVARQKQGGRASDRAAAKLHRSQSLHQRRRGCCAPDPFQTQRRGTEQTTQNSPLPAQSQGTQIWGIETAALQCTGVCKRKTLTRTETRTRGPATATPQSSMFKMRTMGR